MASGDELEFEIRSDREMPIKKGSKKKYPFDRMEVGDSFVVGPALAKKVRNSVTAINRRGNYGKFATRTIYPGGEVGVWKVANAETEEVVEEETWDERLTEEDLNS